MLNRFFKNDMNNSSTKRMYGEAAKWRFKGYAEIPFWRWVTSWAKAIRKPSDIGYENKGFDLPPLNIKNHLIDFEYIPNGELFSSPAMTLRTQREESKRSITERCEKVAELVSRTGNPALIWCHRNEEGDLLESLIDGSVQVAGKHSDAVKETRLMAFADQEARVLITKPRIGAWGLNFQHCSHVCYFPSHSYEAFYQSIRRCWRFGQKHPVTVDVVLTPGEERILANLEKKSQLASLMFENLVNEMNNSLSIDHSKHYSTKLELPQWL
ncbi:MAG: SWF/SNF helicase family protein, partial [Chloroflexi bacterium]|nr:SWF/SNF helicase family protein [Chloroflexota bacterium]